MPINLRALVSDPEFQNFPIQTRLQALQKAGAPQEFIDGYRKIDFNKTHENDWPAPIDVPPDRGNLPEPSFGDAATGIVKGIGSKAGDLLTSPFKELQNDFETDAKNLGPIAGPLKTLVTKSTMPLQLADQATKGITSALTNAANYRQKGQSGLAAASLVPGINQMVPAVNQIQQGYESNSADQMGQGVGSLLTDGALAAVPFSKGTPAFLPESMTDTNVLKSVGKGAGQLATLPLTGTGGLLKILAKPLLESILGAKGEAPNMPKVDINPESMQGPPTAGQLAEQAYKDSTPKGSKVKAIEQGLKSGRPLEDLVAEIMAPKEKPAPPSKPPKISAAEAKAIKRIEGGYVPPAQEMSIKGGELPGTSPLPTSTPWQQPITPGINTTFSVEAPVKVPEPIASSPSSIITPEEASLPGSPERKAMGGMNAPQRTAVAKVQGLSQRAQDLLAQINDQRARVLTGTDAEAMAAKKEIARLEKLLTTVGGRQAEWSGVRDSRLKSE